MFLILFHGQSKIERGFSANKQLLVKNLKAKSLVALWRIKCRKNIPEVSPETIKIWLTNWLKVLKKPIDVIKMNLGN